MGNAQDRKRGWNGPPGPQRGPRGFRVDLAGRTFGQLTVLSHAGSDAFGHARWNCRCECGNVSSPLGLHLTQGKTRSCGCGQISEQRRKHGLPSRPRKAIPRPRKRRDNSLCPLSALDVQAIRATAATKRFSQHHLAKEYGVSQPTISAVLREKTWRAGGA